jgi:hypothetical protein
MKLTYQYEINFHEAKEFSLYQTFQPSNQTTARAASLRVKWLDMNLC